MWLGVSKGAKCDRRDIRRADEWDFSVTTGCIDFALAFDGDTLLFFGEVFYSLVSSPHSYLQLRQKPTHEPSRHEHATAKINLK